jgi:hypothetical protein
MRLFAGVFAFLYRHIHRVFSPLCNKGKMGKREKGKADKHVRPACSLRIAGRYARAGERPYMTNLTDRPAVSGAPILSPITSALASPGQDRTQAPRFRGLRDFL